MERLGKELGNYQLLRLLGSGSFAEVYQAKHLELGTDAAIKLLHAYITDESAKREFLTEGRIIARLNHPYIIRVFDVGFDQTIPYLVMDYVPNGTLREHYHRGSCLPLEIIVQHVNQIAAALQYAHDKNIIHCDVKPENLLLKGNNDIALSDFGIAQIFQSTLSQTTQNPSGTPAYMAPEQFRGKPRPASDQYALGIIVYEWLCGKLPFTGKLYPRLMDKHMNAKPPSLRSIDPTISLAVERVVLKSLAKDPNDRFKSVQTFAQELEQANSQTQQIWPSASAQINISTSIETDLEDKGITQTAKNVLELPKNVSDSVSKNKLLKTQLPLARSENKAHPLKYAFIGGLVFIILLSSILLSANVFGIPSFFRSPSRLATPSSTNLPRLDLDPNKAELRIQDVNALLNNSLQAINDIERQVRNLSFLQNRKVGLVNAYAGAPSSADVEQAERISSKVYEILHTLGNTDSAFSEASYGDPLVTLGKPFNVVELEVYLFT